jgi:hypothetical protein
MAWRFCRLREERDSSVYYQNTRNEIPVPEIYERLRVLFNFFVRTGAA